MHGAAGEDLLPGGLESSPHGVPDAQVVSVRQGLLLGLEDGQLLAVSIQHLGQDPEPVACAGPLARVARIAAFGSEAVVAGQFGSRARARRQVGDLRGQGEYVGRVGVGARGSG